jgi:hypothetical protein
MVVIAHMRPVCVQLVVQLIVSICAVRTVQQLQQCTHYGSTVNLNYYKHECI